MIVRNLLTAFALLTVSVPATASAAALLVENFDYGPNTVLNAPDATFGGKWKTTAGSVDYLRRTGSFGALCGTAPGCVDLDGGTYNAGIFETVQRFAQGTYQLTFQILGSGRGTTEEVTIRFGDILRTVTLGSTDFVDQTSAIFGGIFDKVKVGPGGTTLSFENKGGDNVGAILKSVSVDSLPKVAPVPLPATAWLLLGGLAGLATLRRRRQRA